MNMGLATGTSYKPAINRGYNFEWLHILENNILTGDCSNKAWNQFYLPYMEGRATNNGALPR